MLARLRVTLRNDTTFRLTEMVMPRPFALKTSEICFLIASFSFGFKSLTPKPSSR